MWEKKGWVPWKWEPFEYRVGVMTSFIGIFSGSIFELQSGDLPGVGATLDVVVQHVQPGVEIPLVFRLVGGMAEHWGVILRQGSRVTLSGSLCVSGSGADSFQYYLVNSVTLLDK